MSNSWSLELCTDEEMLVFWEIVVYFKCWQDNGLFEISQILQKSEETYTQKCF